MATQWLIDKFAPSLLVNVGLAGSLSGAASVGSIVLGSKFVQHDFMPAPWLGRPQGEIPFMGERSYPLSDGQANNTVLAIIHDKFQAIKIQLGTILSGDEPIFSKERKDALLNEFAKFTPLAVDMESATFAFTSSENKLPFIVIRAIADRASKNDEPSEPGANARQNGTAALAAQVTAEYIRSIPMA
jgi:adenosylhomocysteine nucleosidase